MKIMTNQEYDRICEIVKDKNDEIEKLKKQNKMLKESNMRLKYLLDKEIEADTFIDFPNCSTEVWNGPKGQIIQPKGTFEKIFNDPDEDQEDKSF